jgi:hypothetical protein
MAQMAVEMSDDSGEFWHKWNYFVLLDAPFLANLSLGNKAGYLKATHRK